MGSCTNSKGAKATSALFVPIGTQGIMPTNWGNEKQMDLEASDFAKSLGIELEAFTSGSYNQKIYASFVRNSYLLGIKKEIENFKETEPMPERLKKFDKEVIKYQDLHAKTDILRRQNVLAAASGNSDKWEKQFIKAETEAAKQRNKAHSSWAKFDDIEARSIEKEAAKLRSDGEKTAKRLLSQKPTDVIDGFKGWGDYNEYQSYKR